MDRQKLAKAISALWILASIPISQQFYNELLDDGLFMRVFALAVVALPVWGYFGWQWLSDGAPISRLYLGGVLAAGAAMSWFLAADRYLDDIEYIPFVMALAFVILAVVGGGTKMVMPLSDIHPDKIHSLNKAKESAASLLSATREIGKAILAYLNAMDASSPMPGVIRLEAEAFKTAYGMVYGAFTCALHDGGNLRHVAILAMYKSQVLAELTAMLMPRFPGLPPLPAEDLSGEQIRAPVLKLMEIEEVKGRMVQQRLIDNVESPYLPFYENLHSYVPLQTTEANLLKGFETKFAELYAMASQRAYLTVSKA